MNIENNRNSNHEDKEEHEQDIKSAENIDIHIKDANVVTKYQKVAEIVNQTMHELINKILPGLKVLDLCSWADETINNKLTTVYKKKRNQQQQQQQESNNDEAEEKEFSDYPEKGIAFPTSISVNNVVNSFSPLKGEDLVLKQGDLVKIEMSAQIDGYAADLAHSFVLEPHHTAAGRKADVIAAAFTAAECVLRELNPGTKSTDITSLIEQAAKEFDVRPVSSAISYAHERYSVSSQRKILSKPDPDMRVQSFEVQANEAYTIDIMMSTGDGRPYPSEQRTTIYRRRTENMYQLKMKASRHLISIVNQKFPVYPFTLRTLGDGEEEQKARFGLVECVRAGLLEPYPVLLEKAGEHVSHIRFTVLVLPSSTVRITGTPIDPSKLTTTRQITSQDLLSLMAQPVRQSSASKRKKKKKQGNDSNNDSNNDDNNNISNNNNNNNNNDNDDSDKNKSGKHKNKKQNQLKTDSANSMDLE